MGGLRGERTRVLFWNFRNLGVSTMYCIKNWGLRRGETVKVTYVTVHPTSAVWFLVAVFSAAVNVKGYCKQRLTLLGRTLNEIFKSRLSNFPDCIIFNSSNMIKTFLA